MSGRWIGILDYNRCESFMQGSASSNCVLLNSQKNQSSRIWPTLFFLIFLILIEDFLYQICVLYWYSLTYHIEYYYDCVVLSAYRPSHFTSLVDTRGAYTFFWKLDITCALRIIFHMRHKLRPVKNWEVVYIYLWDRVSI